MFPRDRRVIRTAILEMTVNMLPCTKRCALVKLMFMQDVCCAQCYAEEVGCHDRYSVLDIDLGDFLC